MPVLSIESNQPLANDASLATISKHVAGMLGKPENYVMIRYSQNPDMLFAGSGEPLAYLELKSLGLPESKTAGFSAALAKLVADELRVSPSRVYIEFASPERHMFGWNGATF
ncbi:MAG: hypothetical protein HZT40_07145 [Candidatus Thiothrix singaporensis]|uniref:L-dopachrome isomerase n=1 Tax=Candidatus Thiothrix singaporensis TaxID=2799669 RepID=A0A7L6AYH4_9GAMM|nr:MAG: hypothetical protein HZT40_07145 [Candidatus Thiothrix singaporensis]